MRVEGSDFSFLFLAHAQYHTNIKINVIMMILTSITILGLVDGLILAHPSLAQDSLRQVFYLDSIVLVSRASAGARD